MAVDPRRRERVALGALLLAATLAFLAVRLPALSVPLERDEGEYAYVAWRLLEGDVPYRDAFDQKPPGVFFAYAAGFLVLGRSVEAIHAIAAFWSAGTAALLFVLMRRLADPLSAGFAVLVFTVASALPSLLATAANTEIFMLLPMVASLLALERGLARERLRDWVACGALAAAACWFKQVAVTHAVFVVVVALWWAPAKGSGAGRPRRLTGLALGGLAVSLPLLAGFAAAGAGGALFDAVLIHNIVYSRSLPLEEGLARLAGSLSRQVPGLVVLWLLAAAGGALGAAAPHSRALLAGWLLASLAGAAVGLRFRPHYFVQAVPALASLAGLALGAAAARLLARPRPALDALGFALLLVLAVGPPLAASRSVLLAGSPDAIARALYGLNPFPESRQVGRHIAKTSEPGDTVFVVGSEPQILFYAERRSATRYIFFYPLMGPYADALERQREAMAEVEASRPLYVVWVHLPTSLQVFDETERWILARSDELLRRDFHIEFVAKPDGAGQGYELAYGRDASRWLREARGQLDQLPWLAVYRRAS